MSTFTELTKITSVEDDDEILVRKKSTSEDTRSTKLDFLGDIPSSVDELQSLVSGLIQESTDQKEASLYKNINTGDTLPFRGEISRNQSNPFPPANSYEKGEMIEIIVFSENTPITTTHLPVGGDITSGISGDGFIINWSNGGTVRFVSNGLNKWSKV